MRRITRPVTLQDHVTLDATATITVGGLARNVS
jgi:hypothetical protein